METTSTQPYITVLSIAGSDPSGGAGIQQDIKTCEALGCYGMAAITSLTAQSPSKVYSVFNTTRFLEAQLSALLDEVRPAAVKIGMLPDAESVEVVAKVIGKYRLENIVVDPVIVSTSGHVLAERHAVKTMTKKLFKVATIVTPNIPEAKILTDEEIDFIEDMYKAAKLMANQSGCQAVMLKGGHLTPIEDVLYIASTDTMYNFPTRLINTPNTHGTGCRLSTAIACGLAKGLSIIDAVKLAKEWLSEDLRKNAFMRFP